MIRLLLVDDHPVVRAGYQRLLEQSPDLQVVAQADHADGALAAFSDHAPEVTVTDLSMPGSGGLDLVRRLRQRHPVARVLVFSMHDTAMLVRRAFEAGALGFLSKSCPPHCLVEAVRSVHDERPYLSPGLPREWLRRPDARDGLDTLTPREFEVFQHLARGQTLAECAQALRLSPKTVSNLQTLVKEKLGVGTTAALVHLAIRHGVIATDGH